MAFFIIIGAGLELFSRDAKRSAEDLFRRDARAERDRRQNYFGSPKRQQGRPCKRFRFAHLACFRGLLTFFRRQDISVRPRKHGTHCFQIC